MKKIVMCCVMSVALCGVFGCGDDGDDPPAMQNNMSNNNSMMGDRTYEACVAETMTYTQFEETISSIGRVGGFESIADLLWRNDALMPMDFVDANIIYVSEEGLDSRVGRREDEHYAPVMEGGEVLRCRDDGVPEKDPDRCVGPAQIRPLVLDAFTKGNAGESPEVQAARAEAGLLWFLYISTYKEFVTCTQTKKDCDSTYAYYTGGQPREGGIGLAAYFREHALDAHDMVWDSLLKMRCWREVDSGDEAMNLALRDRVLAELDRGLLYGLSQLMLWRIGVLEARTDDALKAADWAWLKIIGNVLDREATERDSAKATRLRDALSGEDVPGSATFETLKATLPDVFPKPE